MVGRARAKENKVSNPVIPYECKGCKKKFGNGFDNRSASDQTCPHCGAVNETYTDWTWERGVNGGDEYPFGVTTEVKA